LNSSPRYKIFRSSNEVNGGRKIQMSIFKEEKFILREQKREHQRVQISLPIIFAYSERDKIITKHGTTFDLSDRGLGFYTEKPLSEGLSLQIHLPDIWNSPKSSSVRWCRMKTSSLYRVGVSFKAA
jgi:c-di-GMP-binding flagellar brake protein YcgR